MRRPEGMDFETRDPEVAHAQITLAYAEHRATLLGDTHDFLYRHHRIDMGGVRIDTFRASPTVEYDVESLPYAMVGRVRSGLVTSTTEGCERVVGPGGVFLVSRPLGHYVTRMEDAEIEAVSVDERIFGPVGAPQRSGRPRRPHRPPTSGCLSARNRTAWPGRAWAKRSASASVTMATTG